jgi:hypothetical protein
MATIHAGAIIGALSAVEVGDVAVIRATTRHDVARALRERTSPVIIEDKRLALPFKLLLAVQTIWLIAAIVAYAIHLSYRVEFRHTEWSVGRTTQDEIILTPMGSPDPRKSP